MRGKKKILRRSLAWMLTLAMIMSMNAGTITVGAEENDTSEQTEYVARLGETDYDTVQKAIEAAGTSNSIVTLLKEVTESVVIAEGQNITLDLKGNTITGAERSTIVNNGTLNIITSAGGGTVISQKSYAVENYGVMVIGTENAGAYPVFEDGTANAASLIRNGYDETGGNNIPGKMTIWGGTFTGGMNTVKNEPESVLAIHGGTFTHNYTNNDYTVLNYGDATITNGTFTTANKYTIYTVTDDSGTTARTTARTTITGGNFTAGSVTSAKTVFNESGASIVNVSGGVHNKSIVSNCWKNGYTWIKNDDGLYEMTPGAVALQNSGSTNLGVYDNFADAIGAMESGNGYRLVLLKDVTESITIPDTGKTVYLDLNGYTLTGSYNSEGKINNVVTNNGTLSVTGGMGSTILGGSDKGTGAALVNNSGAKLTFGASCEAVIKRQDNKTFGYYTVINKGTMTIGASSKLVTIENNSNKSSLIINDGGTLTIQKNCIIQQNEMTAVKNDNGTLKITGGTIISENSVAVQNWETATISGGTITGMITTLAWSESAVRSVTSITGGTVNGDVRTINYAGGALADMSPETNISGKAVINGTLAAYTNTTSLVGDKTTDKTVAAINVSGGTFSEKIAEEYCADGFIPAEADADGKYSVVVEPVAQIGDVTYTSLADAINAVPADGTETIITMLADTDISTTGAKISSGMNVVLDLNGKSIKAGNSADTQIVSYGMLTIKDNTDIDKNGTGTGKIYTESGYDASNTSTIIALYGAGARLVMESGLIDTASFSADNTGSGQFAVGVYGDAEAVINGGKILAGWYAISGNGTYQNTSSTIIINGGILESTADYAVYHPQNGNITINGGVIYGQAGGIAMKSGNLEITGGTITSKGTGDTGEWGDGTGNLGAAALNVNASYGEVTVAISEGTLISEDGALIVNDEPKYTSTIDISGGTYSQEVNENYCAAGFVPKTNGDGTYGVEVDNNAVAAIGKNTYTTLQAAVNAAEEDASVITLLKEIYLEETVVISAGQNITLDLNGKTVTVKQTDGRSLYAIDNYGTLTFTDTSEEESGRIIARGVENMGIMYMNSGTIESCDSNGGGAAVWNVGTLEMTGGTLEFSGTQYGNQAGTPINNCAGGKVSISDGTLISPYTSISNSGEMTVEGITLINSTAYWNAVKNNSGGNIVLNNVTINSTYGGGIEVAGGTATLNDCTFTQTEVYDYNSMNISVSAGGIVNVNGGTYTTDGYGLYTFNSGGTINVFGGNFKAGTAVLKADKSVTSNPSSINVSDGIFDGELSISTGAALAVSGGTYTVDPSDYCVEDYTGVGDSDTVETSTQFLVMKKVVSEDGAEATVIGKYDASQLTDNVPTAANRVFAGWFADETCQTPLMSKPTEGTAYAKFIDANVLATKVQLTKGTTTESASTNMRILSSVDTLQYKEVGFKITKVADGAAKQKTIPTTTVYSQVYGVNDENVTFKYNPSSICPVSNYFIALTMNNIGNSDFDSEIRIQAYLITFDGEVSYGEERTFTINKLLQ